ncbi:MAG TPA: type I glyceraldehyde-3-phosphate dehydrogenase [Alphaproteobacteria bacterium]|nr:type I glyceraldehyde-3-phosphate dehydrogenase [Alphaproteobacteria bacterium]
MTINVAINGFGRIGRCVVRALYDDFVQQAKLCHENRDAIKIVAINDLADTKTLSHMLTFDSVHGIFADEPVHASEDSIFVGEDEIKVFAERDPENLPWGDLDVDIVFECTGLFKSKETAGKHIKAGAKKVIVSAPGEDMDKTIVYGVNHEELSAEDTIISNASCTTNCLAPIAKVLDEEIGIESGLMTTIHAYTNDQNLQDAPHKDLRRARAGALSMIPSSTGAAKAVGLVLPKLAGKLDGQAVRVPTPNVSLVDLTFVAKRETSAEEINELLSNAIDNAEVAGVLGGANLPLVSTDFNHSSYSSIFDLTQTNVNANKKLCKVMAWYDNEYGFSNRMLDLAVYFASLEK